MIKWLLLLVKLLQIKSSLLRFESKHSFLFLRLKTQRGFANPAPIIQTFYAEDNIFNEVKLDSDVTLVDAKHAGLHKIAGLQVLQEKNLIHRDLKPQNLLLATISATPLMKIGDFGFARSLTPLQLADTLCGSPYYMTPGIIQSHMMPRLGFIIVFLSFCHCGIHGWSCNY
ncbi:Protein kinase superfamily protein [Trifolium repens]|nr:Protein kinase superfamily protein [Trifolium repens]